MALTAHFVEAHISKWEATLNQPWYPYRTKWPSRLFHHAPIENVVKILTDGNLRSREDPRNLREKDVAAAGVIDVRTHAHDWARLYFRPRTPTQYHIEGIRKPGECTYGEHAHAPVTVMMVFKAHSVLTTPTVKFCDRNMQLGAAAADDTPEYFSNIPFEKVFHVGGTGGDRSIIEHRCAEVLATSPLPLKDNLQWIFCRTAAERETLLFLLGKAQALWSNLIVVSDDLSVFERRFVFVDYVGISHEGVSFQLSPRADAQTIDVQVKTWGRAGTEIISYANTQMLAQPSSTVKRWRVAKNIDNGKYLVEIKLEGHMAYRNVLVLGDKIV
jgi:hypothetical protein